ncbi:MAG: sensor histidine kinase [Pseudonocardia sp.]
MTASLRVRDLGVAGGFLAAGLLLVLAVPDAGVAWWSNGGLPRWADVLALLVACIGETQRRSRPVLGLAIGTAALMAGPLVVGLTGFGVWIAFMDLLYCAVLYSSRRISWAVIGAAGAVLVATSGASLLTGGLSAAVMTLLKLLGPLGVPALWANEVRHHRELADVERDRAEQVRRTAELDRAAAVAAERARMARDLHDVIAGQLSAIAIQSEAALTLPDPDRATLRRVLMGVRRDSVASLAEMRTMIGLLRSDGDADPRTAPAGLDQLGTLLHAAGAAGLAVELDDQRPADAHVAAAVDLAAYRIVQESLTNAAKHAPSSSVRLGLRHAGGDLVIELANALVPGAPSGGGSGVGLLGLSERARAVGGRVLAGPEGSQWQVRAVLPRQPSAIGAVTAS